MPFSKAVATRYGLPLSLTLTGTLLASCSSLPTLTGPDITVDVGEPAFELQILHNADMDGAVGALDNVSQFSALLSHFQATAPDNTVILSSGDNYIPGPRFFAASDDSLASLLGLPGDGRADMAFMNAMGYQASAVGNHDLDTGPGGFASIIAPETDADSGASYSGASFPYLSANLDFSSDEDVAGLIGTDASAASELAGKLAASTTLEVAGETIGVVGATTPTLASITSTGTIGIAPASGDTVELAAAIQSAVDALAASGIDKIILLAHMQQISVEQELAGLLSGVDVIISGGSNSLLADGNDTLRPGDEAVDNYPLHYASAISEPVLLVNTDGDYKYLGRLIVNFDENGYIVTDALDDDENGVYAATDEMVASLGATPDGTVNGIRDALNSILVQRDGNIVGKTAVYLDGRRGQVRSEETNMGNLTADANLWLAQMADDTVAISFKNGGGIRSAIGQEIQPPGSVDASNVEYLPPQANPLSGKQEGDISEFALQGVLRFNNGLALLTLTAAELKDLLEHAVAATEDGATPGRFPQVAGLTFSFDPSRTARDGGDTNGEATVEGDRIRSVELVDSDGNVTDTLVSDGTITGDPSRSFRIVVLDFLANCANGDSAECGDGFPFLGLSNANYVSLVGGATDPGAHSFADSGTEQDALAEYLTAFYSDTPFAAAETPASEDTRIRNLAVQ